VRDEIKNAIALLRAEGYYVRKKNPVEPSWTDGLPTMTANALKKNGFNSALDVAEAFVAGRFDRKVQYKTQDEESFQQIGKTGVRHIHAWLLRQRLIFAQNGAQLTVKAKNKLARAREEGG
jgi:hypothetical protein